MQGDKIKPFYLFRKKDITGISGIGVIAIGAVLSSGRAILEWVATNHSTITIFQNIDEVELIHGHNHNTKVVWGNPPVKEKK